MASSVEIMAAINGTSIEQPTHQEVLREKDDDLTRKGLKVGMTGIKRATGCCTGFCDYLMKSNVIELAVAVVVGLATQRLVTALVTDIITPLISAIFGGTNFSDLYFTVHNSRFLYGDLANQALSFLIILLVVYFLILLPMTCAMARLFPKVVERECPECLSMIDARATRCKFCTVAVPPVEVIVEGKKVHDVASIDYDEHTKPRTGGCCCA